MAIIDIFSKRQQRERGELPDVYSYEYLPENLRVQIVHIFRDGLIRYESSGWPSWELLKETHAILCREYGVFTLTEKEEIRGPRVPEDVFEFILVEHDEERVLDAAELILRGVDRIIRDDLEAYTPTLSPDEVIEDFNKRFQEAGIGYQYESGQIIRVDSQVIHQSAVQPALYLLKDPRFRGADEEFRRAYEHYRHRRFAEALNDALKSLESTLKAICDKRAWAYRPGDTAKKLLEIAFSNELFPSFLQTHYATLRQNLESGVPTVRNKRGGHGQGSQPVEVPQHLAAYQLHMTASAVVFLLECDKALK